MRPPKRSRSDSEDVEQPFLDDATPPSSPPLQRRDRWRTQTKAALAILLLTLLFLLAMLLPPPVSRSDSRLQRSNNTLIPIPVFTGVNDDEDTGNWTLALPASPLTPGAMARTCAAVHHRSHLHRGYYYVDPKFVDPTAGAAGNGSLTYSLAAGGWGLAESLLEVFSAYGLAVHEGRRFALDDSGWRWGAWSDYFSSSSSSSERRVEVGLPCPRSAHRLAVSHATRTFVFGHEFTDQFENPTKAGSLRQDGIFALMRSGVEGMFRLRADLRVQVERRKKELARELGEGAWVGVHVRRGDWKPRTWKWRNEPGGVPLDVVADIAAELSGGRGRVVVMSDDPTVPGAPQLAGSIPAVESGMHGVLEGGWSRAGFEGLTVDERRFVGRRFLVEMAVVAELAGEGTEGGVVCAAGSATCRLLAVLVGWENSILAQRWRDVDGGLGWSGVDW
ncbi:hypothetical protein FN846DRAFT_914820 [Sphaerosporella brunnea]|uniref:Uncharacterized protein n=1 Tax=Sphaerosporella brunnea TaxID=1250544 RepID=A0A5J5EBA0_9PEZI|nr:hypothetical protein FN846DRAFT_914820 [Sphaerosporella brunnea]